MTSPTEGLQDTGNPVLAEAFSDITQIETSLTDGEFTPQEALTEMFDVYWSNAAAGLDDEEKQSLQVHIFERAKERAEENGIDFQEVLETWQQIAEQEQAK